MRAPVLIAALLLASAAQAGTVTHSTPATQYPNIFGLTACSIIFGDSTGHGAQDNASLCFDDVNNRLKINATNGGGYTQIGVGDPSLAPFVGGDATDSYLYIFGGAALAGNVQQTLLYVLNDYTGGNTSEVIGHEAEAKNGAANLTYFTGVEGNAKANGTGSVTYQDGVGGYNERNGAGTTALMSSFHAYAPTISAGTVTINAGVTIDNQAGSGAGTDYQIYSPGTAPSLFNGTVNGATLQQAGTPLISMNDGYFSLSDKPAVTVVSVANQTLSGIPTVDSVALADGSLVLCTAQSTGAQNGPWVVHSGAWTRPTWYTSGSTTQAAQFLTTHVRLGTLYSNTLWRMTTASVTIDTTSTTWANSPLALNTQTVSGNLPMANGGTNASLTADAGGIVYSTGSALAILAHCTTAGQILRTNTTSGPLCSTATYPSLAGTAANFLRSDGTNYLSAAIGDSDLPSTLTSKTLGNTNTITVKDTLFTLQDDADTTKQAVFQLGNITTGTTRTYTLQNASGTIPLIGTANTISANWTFSASLLNTGITSDATHTDSSVCQDTTTHQFYAGSGTLGVCLGTSSKRYKNRIEPLKPGLSQIAALKPVSFYYNKDHGDYGAKLQYGFLAEDVAEVMPKLVDLDTGKKPNSVDILGMVPVLVKAVQEMQAEIADLKAQNAALRATVH